MNNNRKNFSKKISILGISGGLLILLIGFLLKSNSVKIAGIITGLGVGFYGQTLNKNKNTDELEKISELFPELESKNNINIEPIAENAINIEPIEENNNLENNHSNSKNDEQKNKTLDFIQRDSKIFDTEIDNKFSQNFSIRNIGILYLNDDEEIKKTIDQLTNYSILWVDTEIADWENKYKKRISLIQLSHNSQEITGGSVYLLDLLDKSDLIDYFIEKIMVNEKIEKVFHNAPFDVNFLGGKDKVKNVTCTYQLSQKISLEKLGSPNRKLKTLASCLCNFTVEENEQKSDWSKRPLSSEQIQYAMMDIVFLTNVHRELLIKYQGEFPRPLIKIRTEKTDDIKSNFQEELDKVFLEKKENNKSNYWVYNQMEAKFNLNLEQLKIIAKALNYREGWAYYRYKEIYPHLSSNNANQIEEGRRQESEGRRLDHRGIPTTQQSKTANLRFGEGLKPKYEEDLKGRRVA